ncbi:SdiA-regulated domain-containing protein [Salinimicrobium sp. GXAS 041]|uniref:SdiA-regulated domain-containing protein n=1 Tax=Salinimicrobium sp. GXAS 041 TaxID=3400806 RepID=UPI003C7367E8
MSVYKAVISISTGLILLVGILYFSFLRKNDAAEITPSQEIIIEETWELPNILEEVSGIAFLDDQRVACIQDEDGTIFVYDLKASKIVEEIDFAGGGDYEAISISENTAYVLRSDGTIFKITQYLSNPVVTEHELPLKDDPDMEGMTWNSSSNKLWLVNKEKDANKSGFKSIYVVDPETMKLQEEPVYKIPLENAIFETEEEKESMEDLKPSELNIHPITGEIYVLEGHHPKLLVLDSDGNPKKLYILDSDNFPQPEGLAFDASGGMYISNEGNKATIHKISIHKN